MRDNSWFIHVHVCVAIVEKGNENGVIGGSMVTVIM